MLAVKAVFRWLHWISMTINLLLQVVHFDLFICLWSLAAARPTAANTAIAHRQHTIAQGNSPVRKIVHHMRGFFPAYFTDFTPLITIKKENGTYLGCVLDNVG